MCDDRDVARVTRRATHPDSHAIHLHATENSGCTAHIGRPRRMNRRAHYILYRNHMCLGLFCKKYSLVFCRPKSQNESGETRTGGDASLTRDAWTGDGAGSPGRAERVLDRNPHESARRARRTRRGHSRLLRGSRHAPRTRSTQDTQDEERTAPSPAQQQTHPMCHTTHTPTSAHTCLACSSSAVTHKTHLLPTLRSLR